MTVAKGSSVTVVLTEPVEVAGEYIDAITLRRPKGKDMKTLSSAMNMGDMMKMAAKLSGHLPVVFDEMDSYDVTQVLQEVGNFFTSGPTTGA